MSGEREARLWFAQALADLDTARDNARSHPDAACLMAQQAAEKALKALEAPGPNHGRCRPQAP